ncbi:Trigger factor [Hyella patelloides LEGE 07179]|uniref:Trigger factor n=1 Tax=Hyella patelloides LEGE 07179 TaxID=945734 RepID=A0A563VJ96_9CYAN|nr:trigger factor [Hyella patelloides]VEP11463.1 Trigger factor [Hyella patelloides LEGE 07179]
MKVTQEKLPDSQIGLEIEISGDTSRNTYEKVISQLARSSNIPGFRKGKVPRPVLLQRMGTQRIKAAALEEIIQTSLADALKQEDINALGNYTLRSSFDELVQQYEPGETLVFSAAVDVVPSPELGDYQNLSVKAEESQYESQELSDYLEQLRNQQADVVPVENRAAESGDIAIVDFAGKLTEGEAAGTEIEGGTATDFQVELVEGKLIPGMIEGIIGMKPEETKEVAVTFPEDYPKEELAGQPADFSITLKELKTKELPELDDDFAEEASNGEHETLAAFKESLEKQFQEKADNETKNNINNALIEVLLEQSQVEIPETMLQEEVTQVLTQTLMQMQQMGLDVKQIVNSDTVPRMRENARPEAITNLKKSLVLAEIAAQENLKPDESAIKDKMAEISQELVDREIDQEKLRTMVEEDLTTENTLDWLREKAQVELLPPGSLAEAEEAESEETETESEGAEAESNPETSV